MVFVFNRFYVHEVWYSGFAGRLYGYSRLITSGTCYLAKTGYVQRDITPFFMLLVAPMAAIVESKFLSHKSSLGIRE